VAFTEAAAIEKKIAPIDAVNKSLGYNLKVQLSQGAAIVRRPQRGPPRFGIR
jgi:hypothetical protein